MYYVSFFQHMFSVFLRLTYYSCRYELLMQRPVKDNFPVVEESWFAIFYSFDKMFIKTYIDVDMG